MVCLCQGIAITSFMAMIKDFLKNPNSKGTLTIINVDSKESNLFSDALKEDEDKKFTFLRTGNREEFKNAIKNVKRDDDTIFYLSGSETMLKDTAMFLLTLGIEKNNILIDRKDEKVKAIFS